MVARGIIRAAARTGLSIGLAAVSATGCYRYVAPEGTSPLVGTEIRAHLTGSGSASLAPLLGTQVASVDGRIAATGESSLVMLVSRTTRADGASVNWTGERVSVGRAVIGRYEVRVLDRKRTVMAAGLAVAAALVAGKLFNLGRGRGSAGPDEPGPPPA